jgi:hypothetical protein
MYLSPDEHTACGTSSSKVQESDKSAVEELWGKLIAAEHDTW